MCTDRAYLGVLLLAAALANGCNDDGILKTKKYGSDKERFEISLFGDGCSLGFTDTTWHEGRVLVIDATDAPNARVFRKMLSDGASWKYDQVAVYFPESIVFDLESAELLNKLERFKILHVPEAAMGAETANAIGKIESLEYVWFPWKGTEKEILESRGANVFPKK